MIEENWNAMHRLTFVERSLEMHAVEHALFSDQRRLIHITAAAGMGKTELVRRIGERFRDRFSGGVVFVRQPTNNDELFELRKLLGERSGSTLLLYDGIDEGPWPLEWHLSFLRGIEASLADVQVIATSRPINYPKDYPSFEIALSAFSQDEAKELLQRVSLLYGKIPSQIVDLAAGNPLLLLQIAQISVERGDYWKTLATLSSFERPGLLGADGKPLRKNSHGLQKIVASVGDVNKELLARVKFNPDEVFELTPRQYEEVTAELFHQLGFNVTLTPASKDGGKDLMIAHKDSLGSFLYFVECKRYSPERPVGVEIVNALSGVVERGRATAGIIMTTSRFTKGAREIEHELQHRLSLKDYSDFKALLDELPSH